MLIDWTQFKSFVAARKTDILMLEDSIFYYLYTCEHALNIHCNIDKNSSDITELDDFEDNYKSLCNPQRYEIVKPSAPLNEHCMQPWGCEKGYFKSKNASEGDYVCAITLSNKSQDGKTFNYNEAIPIVPTVGNYVFQAEASRRSWITAVNTTNKTVTFEMPNLDNGDGIYSKGYYVDVLVRDWKPLMYLWGLTLTVLEYEDSVLETSPCGDFIELSVIDKDGAYDEDLLLANGFEINGEYLDGNGDPIPTKYYDESWILSTNGTYTPAPDGSPGELYPRLYLRLSFFTTENEEHEYHIFADYYPTSKD
jgi:hypothetical protein